jgi:23S rRNA (guanosine2251-2'-O)-methyltransferase
VIVYGQNAVREALQGRRQVREVWGTRQTAHSDWLGVPVVETTAAELERRCGSADHQGVCALVSSYPYASSDELLEPTDALVICLDQVQDPQNLGSICRVCECAGATGVVLPTRRAASVTAAVCRASAGAVEHLPIARVRNIADYLGAAKDAGAWVYAASQRGAVPYTAVDFSGKVVLVLGSESRGIRPRVEAMCDQRVSIPVLGNIDSLNVSSACSVILYRILQIRRPDLTKDP